MKKMKRIFSAVLVFVMAVTMLCSALPATEVMATETKNWSFFVGEKSEFEYYTSNLKIKSISSNKKSIVAAKKTGKAKFEINVKKKGSAVVTVKTNKGTIKYNIKAEKPAFEIKVIGENEGYVFYSVKNNTKKAVERVRVNCKFVNPEGEVVDTNNSFNVSYLNPGDTAYEAVYYSRSTYTVDPSLSSGKVDVNGSSYDYENRYKYINCNKKLKVTTKDDPENYQIMMKFQSSYGEHTCAAAEMLLYDEEDNLIDILGATKYLNAKAVDTSNLYFSKTYDHCKIVKRAYCEMRK